MINLYAKEQAQVRPKEDFNNQSLSADFMPTGYLFDEATNSLNASNERMIVEKLIGFYQGRTVVAHRLSTVRNADQIIVLDKGHVVETGNHDTLTAKRGAYYNLVKNQLELGN